MLVIDKGKKSLKRLKLLCSLELIVFVEFMLETQPRYGQVALYNSGVESIRVLEED